MHSKGMVNTVVLNVSGPSKGGTKCWKWDLPFMTSNHQRKHNNYAIIILNRPITQNPEFMRDFWNDAAVRITVDGGTVRWDTYLNGLPQNIQNTMKLPDLITGDFDSITADVMEKYKNKSCKLIKTPDQNYTDFTKSLVELNKHCQKHKIEISHIMAIAQSSGRLDQILGNIQTLFLAKNNYLKENLRLYLMTDDAISWLLAPGDHVISIPEESRVHKRAWCSLVPIGETCTNVTTSGLKWNLNDQSLKFGHIVSTSNTFSGSETVKITCSHTILWSMRLPNTLAGC